MHLDSKEEKNAEPAFKGNDSVVQKLNKPSAAQIKQDDVAKNSENDDPISELIHRLKSKHKCYDLVNVKPFRFNLFRVPLLLFYLVTVAQAAEITVKCRSISNKFRDLDSISLFVFFELEVFAFAGIIIGLWIWLSIKYCLSCLFQGGPEHTFKTPGVKLAKDQLVRNFVDVFIYTGLFWDVTINLYLLSELNVARDVMVDSQKSLIK